MEDPESAIYSASTLGLWSFGCGLCGGEGFFKRPHGAYWDEILAIIREICQTPGGTRNFSFDFTDGGVWRLGTKITQRFFEGTFNF